MRHPPCHPLSVAGSSGSLALVEGLADESLDDGLAADVEFFCEQLKRAYRKLASVSSYSP